MGVVPGDGDVMNRCVNVGEVVAEAEVAAPHLACPAISCHLFEAGRLVVVPFDRIVTRSDQVVDCHRAGDPIPGNIIDREMVDSGHVVP